MQYQTAYRKTLAGAMKVVEKNRADTGCLRAYRVLIESADAPVCWRPYWDVIDWIEVEVIDLRLA